MNLNRYIFISIFCHLLFTGFLIIKNPFPETPLPVFDVKLVQPFETVPPPAEKKTAPEIIRVNPAMDKEIRRMPETKDLTPDTLYGKETGSPERAGKGPARAKSPNRTNEPERTAPKGNSDRSSASLEEDYEPLPPDEGEEPMSPGFSLFDRKTIEKFASKTPPSNTEKGLTFDAPELKHRGYMRLLKGRIESTWKYPKEAEKLGLSGDLYIKFSIKRNGELGEVELVRTSGYRDLDEAAIDALKKAFPWWPLPKDYKGEELEITGHFIYIYGNRYLL